MIKYRRPIVFVGTRTDMEPLLEIAEERNRPILGILDRFYVGKKFEGVDVIGSDLDLIDPNNKNIQDLIEHVDFFVVTFFAGTTNTNVLSENTFHLRMERINLVKQAGCNLTNLLHPNSSISRTASIGRNTLVFEKVSIESHVKIGSFCQFTYNNIIAHHSVIGNNCTFLPGTTGCTGNITIGNNVVVGVDTHIMSAGDSNTVIGDNVILAPKLAIFKDIPSNTTVHLNGKMTANNDFTTEAYERIGIVSNFKRIS